MPPEGAHGMALEPAGWRPLVGGVRRPVMPLPFAGPVHAVAGIGNPGRFLATLEGLGVEATLHPFADHHGFRAEDLAFGDGRPVVMTAKDAIKCRELPVNESRDLATPDGWVLEVEARPDAGFVAWLEERLKTLRPLREASRSGASR